MTPTTRQKTHDPATFTPAQQAEFGRLKARLHFGSDGMFHGPHDGWLLSGDFSRIINELVHYVQSETVLDKGLSELAICIAGQWYQANPEWAGHAPGAIRNGIPQSVMDDVLAGRRPTGTPEQELVYDVCTDMLRDHRISDELYARAVATFTERGLMDIIATVGTYTIVSMTLDVFECRTAPGVPSVFSRQNTTTATPADFWAWAKKREALLAGRPGH